MAGGVMVAENPETVHIFLPYEIVEVDTVGDNLIVIARPHMKGQACSFTLSPESALPIAWSERLKILGCRFNPINLRPNKYQYVDL
jgi:hypothetical protein